MDSGCTVLFMDFRIEILTSAPARPVAWPAARRRLGYSCRNMSLLVDPCRTLTKPVDRRGAESVGNKKTLQKPLHKQAKNKIV